jgi:enoyl-CoA hydratase/carnithine racemase
MLEIGFIQQVANDVPQLIDKTDALAREIAQNAPLALRTATKVKRTSAAVKTAEAKESTQATRRTLDSTADCLEGLSSFAEKQDPVFTGR